MRCVGVPVQAEVLMLNRTILITGTNITARYKPSPPPPWPNPARQDGVWPNPWSAWANSSWPTEGLHVLAVGLCDGGSANGANCQSNGGLLKARYVRVEKAGQVSGKHRQTSAWLNADKANRPQQSLSENGRVCMGDGHMLTWTACSRTYLALVALKHWPVWP